MPAPWANPAAQLSFLVDASSTLGVAQVQSRFAQGQGKPADPDAGMPVGGGRTVWFQVVMPKVAAPFESILTVPRAGLASVRLYSVQADGTWTVKRSGYNVASADWPKRFLYPAFPFTITPGSEPVYLAVSNVSASVVPVVWRTPADFDDLSVKIHMGLAAYSGLILLIVLISLINSVLWADSIHAVYAAYALVTALAQSAVIGLGGEYLWPNSPGWNSIAAVVGGASFMSLAAIFIWRLIDDRGSRIISILLLTNAALGFLIVISFFILGRAAVMPFYTNYFLASVVLYLAVLAWYSLRYGTAGWWIFAGFLALSVGSMLVLLPTLGFPSFTSIGRYASPIGAALEIPLVFIGLYMRSRMRHDNRQRLNQAVRVDALTGISSHAVLEAKLDQQLRTFRPGAVLRIRLANAQSITEAHGAEGIELALVYAGACIASCASQFDTAARHRDGSFVLLLSGRISQPQTAEIAQRIVAHGLRRTPAFSLDLPLVFQVAAVTSPFITTDAQQLLKQLDRVLRRRGTDPSTFIAFSS